MVFPLDSMSCIFNKKCTPSHHRERTAASLFAFRNRCIFLMDLDSFVASLINTQRAGEKHYFRYRCHLIKRNEIPFNFLFEEGWVRNCAEEIDCTIGRTALILICAGKKLFSAHIQNRQFLVNLITFAISQTP